MANKASKKPTGLKITRNGAKFICEWSIPAAGYGDGQWFKASQYRETRISGNKTKMSVDTDLNSRYPEAGKKKMVSFTFAVCGNTDKEKKDNLTTSKWNDKSFNMYPPKVPAIKYESQGENVARFSWTVEEATANSHFPFKKVVVQTALVKDCNYAPKNAPASIWETYVPNNSGEYTSTQSGYPSGSSGYVQITENSSTLANGNYTRLIRVMAQGCAGDSTWAYASRVYGAPNQTQVTDTTTNDTAGGYDVKVDWDTAYDRSTPIDETTMEWAIAVPNADMTPSGSPSWTSAGTIKDTQKNEAYHIGVTTRLDYDQCLYIRVNTKHDTRVTHGEAVLSKVGVLKKPSSLSVSNVDRAAQTVRIQATNESAVVGSQLAIIYRKNGAESIVGVIDGSPNYKTVKCPEWTEEDTVTFGVRAFLPRSITSESEEGVTTYSIDPYMVSDTEWQAGSVAVAPGGLSLTHDSKDVIAKWKNNWKDANLIELSWSENPNAWESTDAPESFEIENPFATLWRIANLGTGTTWYVKVRSIFDAGEGRTYSPYSNMASISLSSAPNIPILELSKGVVAQNEGFTASWEYNSTDGTPQSEARIYEVVDGTYEMIAHTTTEETIDLPGWEEEGPHALCVEVVSTSGCTSEKSAVVNIEVAEPVTCSMSTSLTNVTVTDDDLTTRTVRALTSLPMTVAVTGAGVGGVTSVVIIRTEPYHVERPDESEWDGYEGEEIYSVSQNGEGAITIGIDDLVGSLDDGAEYAIIASVTDPIGQKASATDEFTVIWADQALVPSGYVIMDRETLAAVVTPIAPTGTRTTDTCDIYRLSADKPVLVYKGAEFGEKYVDPFPAFGENGGYRFVYRTKDGDYTTDENVIAFYDNLNEHLRVGRAVIDFGNERVELKYDLSFDSDLKKQFTEEETLGGAIHGYWNAGVSRKGSVSATITPAEDDDIVSALRRLGEHIGHCHVRTPEGSSFPADVQESDSWDSGGGSISTVKLTITRVDPERVDGMTYAEWAGEE